MGGAGRNCTSIRTCVVVLRDWTLQADREDFKIQSNVLLCCSVAISLAIYWNQKNTASTHWDSEQLGEKTALRLGDLVFKVAKSRSVMLSAGPWRQILLSQLATGQCSVLFLTARDSSGEPLLQKRHWDFQQFNTELTQGGTSSTRITPGEQQRSER